MAGAMLLGIAPVALTSAWATDPGPLAFRIDEGRNINAFVRDGATAAHLVLRSGAAPRLLVAFPAGNSGVGLWFEHADKPIEWKLLAPAAPLSMRDARDRPLNGVSATIEARADALVVDEAVLSSVRVLRDFELSRALPDVVKTTATVQGNTVIWQRDRLDGAPGYRLEITLENGRIARGADGRLRLAAGNDGVLRFGLRALTGETPLTPLGGDALLTPAAANDTRAREVLSFLSYREKFLAGSWRFDTYFGRDTLMSVRLLMPVLQPDAVESGLGAVLARLSPEGEVAHEEDIGEFALLRRRAEGGAGGDTPIHDYGMIDDDFMLAPVAAAWLLDDARGRARAAAFLARPGAGDALARNLLWVVRRSAAFAADPRFANLVAIKPGRRTGQWRDSEEGLGRGRYPYDVNAVFAPAALDAIARLSASGLLDRHLSSPDRTLLARAGEAARVWREKAPPLFVTRVERARAGQAIGAYAAEIGVAAGAEGSGDVRFDALALDEAGRAVPVMHSDTGFALLFGAPDADAIARALDVVLTRFPAGLETEAGVVVANPAYADAGVRQRFGRSAYHGTVIWSWQQAVLLAGVERQLARKDLPEALHARLEAARTKLTTLIAAQRAWRASELWTWAYDNGRFVPAAFGQGSGDEDESNAAQLWSTVFLALDGTN
ncbi:hypothetical protein [Sphingomonas sp. LaA6.9]|uniref:hypothetical protein n=1 Tax=Sphingomonas sp. LaA6.9 TaxID=2919914 RepID=UPI001F4F769E|nr:hypothetical protein [Sphingomonas sp. LaA6.9]MCJ8156744.1 hypothetical protein [Sphingomonas sp. LaA6.9]